MREQREVLHLLANDEAKRGQHGNAAVRDLRLAPAANLLDRGCVVEQVGRVEDVRERVSDARQRLCICATQKRRSATRRNGPAPRLGFQQPLLRLLEDTASGASHTSNLSRTSGHHH